MNWDQKLFFKINGSVGKNRFLDVFGRVGAKYVVFFLFLLILFVIWVSKGNFEVLKFLVIFTFVWLLAFIVNFLIGIVVRRPRPYLTFSEKAKPLFRPKFENWKSFPSDHAMTVFVIFFLLLFFSPTIWIWALLPLVLWVCWSRVFCGVHYPGDMLGGMLVAFLSVLSLFII